MQLICIGHKPPAFAIPAKFHFVTPYRIEGHPSIVIPDDYLGEPFNGQVLSEYTQLFVLAQKLEAEKSQDPIYFFQYRKFISTKEPKNHHPNVAPAFVCDPNEARAVFPTPDDLSMLSQYNFVGPIMRNGITEQYFAMHIPRDLICFSIALSKLAEFDAKRIDNFVSCPILFPAPALGLYHPYMFIRHMRILQKAWISYYEDYYVAREGYQKRVGGFLLERLHSFLLFEELENKENRHGILSGYQVVISDVPETKNP